LTGDDAPTSGVEIDGAASTVAGSEERRATLTASGAATVAAVEGATRRARAVVVDDTGVDLDEAVTVVIDPARVVLAESGTEVLGDEERVGNLATLVVVQDEIGVVVDGPTGPARCRAALTATLGAEGMIVTQLVIGSRRTGERENCS
jgi:hypothetical protein